MKYYISEISAKGSVAVDDNILVKGTPASCGSRMLESFVPLFNAEAVDRLINAGYEISGKTNIGEFSLDLLGETSYFGECTENGNLVSAAASLVAKGDIDAAVNTDVSGYPRRAAAVSGIDFLKPTYGTVSRYGIVAAVCSAEQIGVSAKNAKKVKELISVIAGHDSKDGTSLPADSYSYELTSASGMKVCIIKELFDKASDDVKKSVSDYADKLRSVGVTVDEVSVPEVFAIHAAWNILLCAEFCNNVSRFDGVKYGYRSENYKNIDELYVNSRTEGFGFITKASVLYGSDVLSKGRYNDCYDKALRIRRVALNKMKELFASYNAVLTPVCSQKNYQPYEICDAFEKAYDENLFTAIPSITGLPAMVTKGVQLIADSFCDATLLSLADSVEETEVM
ncbi:MAG: hypothetical protein IJB86_06230 [Clostridia bacterium]|nr:hypothetical protein [Clostridia bacterium]